MRKCFRVGVAVVAMALFGSAHAQSQSQCDPALVQQYESLKNSYSSKAAWLRLINEATFNKMKTDAGVGIYDDWIRLDWSQFQEKRRQFLSQDQGSESLDIAREQVKLSLTSDQLKAWVECVNGQKFVAFVFTSPDSKGATLNMLWLDAGGDIGALKKVVLRVDGGTIDGKTKIRLTKPFLGTETLILKRDQGSDGTVRGTLTGIAGANNKSYSSAFYLPTWQPDVPVGPPKRLVVDASGKVLTATAWWAHGRAKLDFTCTTAPSGMELVLIETVGVRANHSLLGCVPPGMGYCTGHGEHCTAMNITRGCFVNKEWNDWYVNHAHIVGAPYSKELACSTPGQELASMLVRAKLDRMPYQFNEVGALK